MIPLYGFVAGDTMGTLVLAAVTDTSVELCAKMQASVSLRVAPLTNPQVIYKGQVLLDQITVSEMNMAPLERIDLVSGLESGGDGRTAP